MANKYNARKTVIDGITFDSKKESRRYNELRLLQAAGQISRLELQPQFEFPINGELLRYPSGRKVTYRADFKYLDRGRWIVEDVKGFDTDMSKLKRGLVSAIHNVRVVIV